MPQGSVGNVAPIDYAVIEVPRGIDPFSGELARELSALVEAELIRLVDVIVVARATDGAVTVAPVTTLPQGLLLVGDTRRVLPEDEIVLLTSALAPGRAFGVVVYENTWAQHLGGAVREMGGRMVTTGRIFSGGEPWEPTAR